MEMGNKALIDPEAGHQRAICGLQECGEGFASVQIWIQ
ncbi:MAG: hypothetical protein ACJAVR_003691 [Paracoccaceae bacterium]|jgi:hypothetical protein